MKFTLAQLRKLNFPYSFTEEIDLRADLIGLEDILDVKKVLVDATITEVTTDLYQIDFAITADLILECAASLKEVPYQVQTNAQELFSINPDNNEAFQITGQTLDTKEAIITNLLIAKPSKVYAEGEEFISDEEETATEEKPVNEAFKSLKDLLQEV